MRTPGTAPPTRVHQKDGDALWGELNELVYAQDLRHMRSAHWPGWAERAPVEAMASMQWPDGDIRYLLQDERGAGRVTIAGGSVAVSAFGRTVEDAQALIDRVRQLQPEAEPAEDKVQISFWSYGPHGAQAVIREIDAPRWEDIIGNYGSSSRALLSDLVDPRFQPGVGGQLLLWAGDAGTGKTTALRGVAREWKGWCSLHYITDPEKFFGSQADYMIQVLLGGGDEIVREGTEQPKWRLLVLEDCGDMLRKDAGEVTGKALSRLLNTVDGLIGQGLRVMVLVTTNEEIGELHAAIARPGRCAVEIKFERLEASEAEEWRHAHTLYDGGDSVKHGAATLAELYAELEGFRGATRRRRPAGFVAA